MSFNYTPTAQYPGADALAVFLTAANIFTMPITPEDLLFDLAGAAASAMTEFERISNWRPFLASSEDVTKRFSHSALRRYTEGDDLPAYGWDFGFGGGYGGCYWELPFNRGLVSATSVVIGTTTYDLTSATPQAFLAPVNAAEEGKPYESIVFTSYPGNATGPNQIAITGLWGYCAVLPADVWTAVLGYQARKVCPALSIKLRGNMASWTSADVSEKYIEKPFQDAMDQWRDDFNATAIGYRRTGIY